jgi:plastocyanin
MTRSVLLFFTGIVIFGAGLFLFLRVRAPAVSAVPPTAIATREPTESAAGGPPTRSVQITVDGLNFAFAPPTLSVREGTRVTWVNRTASPHTITSVVPKLFDVPIAGHAQVALVFHRPGSYQYFCALHPYMLGSITVRR